MMTGTSAAPNIPAHHTAVVISGESTGPPAAKAFIASAAGYIG